MSVLLQKQKSQIIESQFTNENSLFVKVFSSAADRSVRFAESFERAINSDFILINFRSLLLLCL